MIAETKSSCDTDRKGRRQTEVIAFKTRYLISEDLQEVYFYLRSCQRLIEVFLLSEKLKFKGFETILLKQEVANLD